MKKFLAVFFLGIGMISAYAGSITFTNKIAANCKTQGDTWCGVTKPITLIITTAACDPNHESPIPPSCKSYSIGKATGISIPNIDQPFILVIYYEVDGQGVYMETTDSYTDKYHTAVLDWRGAEPPMDWNSGTYFTSVQ